MLLKNHFKKQDAIYVPVLKKLEKIWKIRNKLIINDAEDIKSY